MKRLLYTNIVWLFLIFNIYGQPASVTWNCTEPDSQNVSAVSGNILGFPETGSAGFVVRDYSKTGGPIGNFQRWWPYENGAAVSWGNETGQVDTRYIQFAVKPKAGNGLNIDSLSLYLGAGGTSNIKANILYSTDSTFATSTILNDSALTLGNNIVNLFSYAVNKKIQENEVFYLRVYTWYTGSPSTSKYVYIQEVAVKATAQGITYPASVNWALTDPAAGGTGQTATTTGQVSGLDEILVNTGINQYSGPNSSQRIRISNNSWPANQTTQIDTVYMEFAGMPNSGFKFNVSTISLGIAAASINTMKANIYYSTDTTNWTPVTYSTGDTSGNNYLRRDSLTIVTASPNVIINPGQKFYIRIYPWVDNDPAVRTGKYVCIQDIKMEGDIEGLPNPASSTWPLTDPSAGGTGLAPVTSGGVIANQEMLNNTEINQYSGPNNSQRIRIAGNSWPANQTTQIDSVYIEFSASPKFGGQLFVDSVSLGIAATSINTMKANIYYSVDTVNWTPVSYSTGDTSGNNYLSRTELTPVSASPGVLVNSGHAFYVRVYPWVDNDPAVRTGKYVNIQNVVIAGTVTGVTADPPVVTTDSVTYISTTFATSGGNIPSDGGLPVTARGVVWDTASNPTISNFKTTDGNGSGAFNSRLIGLQPAVTYYVRAYATNNAGTSYGTEYSFTTLDSLRVPTVTTADITDILNKSAKGGGTVSDWGGDTVTARGICWNLTGNPSISDNKTTNGKDIGSFTSTLSDLIPNTKYYVRAYGVNNIGTGYGAEISFTTQQTSPPVTKVVAKDGSGDYTTVQAAFDAVPDNYTGQYTIYVKKGIYKEKMLLGATKVNVILKGEDRDSTILTYDDYAAIAGGTSTSYSVGIDAGNFTAMDITFQNTYKNDGSSPSQQAVALRSNGDKQSFYNCKVLGYQDTYYAWGGSGTGRVYFKDCYIEGSVDFIFGRDVVIFDSCEIHENRNGGSLTAASTDSSSSFGLVFLNCKITADSLGFDGNPITGFFLGRPWQGAPRTAYINCYEPASLSPAGWTTMQVQAKLFAEYNCYGPGSDTTQRIQWSSRLTTSEASEYTIANIFSKQTNASFSDNWLPEIPVTSVDKSKEKVIPTTYALFQNFPNPFNPSTIIRYSIPKSGMVTIKIYDILGREVATLVNKEQPAGQYNLQFDASALSSGVYFYSLRSGNFVQTNKMMLLK